jgi:hypothetical protein
MMKFLVGLLIIACIAPLFLKRPDGEPIMTLDDWKVELPASLRGFFADKFAEKSVEPEQPPAADIYKWQDDDGQWHFSNTPPDLETGEKVAIGEVNLMEAYVPPQEPEAESPMTVMPAGPMTASPNQVKEMMETVTNLQETIDERNAEVDTASGRKN